MFFAGEIEVKWPTTGGNTSSPENRSGRGAGCAYVIFEHEDDVKHLLTDAVFRKGRFFLPNKVQIKS